MYRLMYEIYNDVEKRYQPVKPVRVRDLYITIDDTPVNIINRLSHGLTFATDIEINSLLYQEYHNQYGVYANPMEMLTELTAFIDMNRVYWEEYFKTTQYEYNPIENYDMTETEADSRCSENQSQGNQINDLRNVESGQQFGYNESTPTDTIRTESLNTGSVGTNRAERSRIKGDRELRRHGNIGVTTTQQMIQSQRDVLISVVRKYVESFRPLFMII